MGFIKYGFLDAVPYFAATKLSSILMILALVRGSLNYMAGCNSSQFGFSFTIIYNDFTYLANAAISIGHMHLAHAYHSQD